MSQTNLRVFYWIWLVPLTIIVAASIAGNEHMVAVGVGLAGALSLSGSI